MEYKMAASLATLFLLLVLEALMGVPKEENCDFVLTKYNFDESLESLFIGTALLTFQQSLNYKRCVLHSQLNLLTFMGSTMLRI